MSVSSNLTTTTFEALTGTASSLLSDLLAFAPSMYNLPLFEFTLRTDPVNASAFLVPPCLLPPYAKSPLTTLTVSPTLTVTVLTPSNLESGFSNCNLA